MSGDPFGEVVVSQRWDRDSREPIIEIQRADPTAALGGDLYRATRADGSLSRSLTIDGDVVTIKAANRTVIYRIESYDPYRDLYLMRWPD